MTGESIFRVVCELLMLDCISFFHTSDTQLIFTMNKTKQDESFHIMPFFFFKKRADLIRYSPLTVAQLVSDQICFRPKRSQHITKKKKNNKKKEQPKTLMLISYNVLQNTK